MTKKQIPAVPSQLLREEQKELTVRASRKEIAIMGLIAKESTSRSRSHHMTPYMALKYYQSSWQCFSEWTPQELREFSGFLEKLRRLTWQQIYETAGALPKRGLGYTRYTPADVRSTGIRSKLESVAREISEDISFFELRVNQNKLRVHGFQSHSAFFLVALDRRHEAFP